MKFDKRLCALGGVSLIVSIAAVGCGSDPAPAQRAPVNGFAGAPGITPVLPGPTAAAGRAAVPTGFAGGSAAAAGSGATNPPVVPAPAPGMGGVPCDVATVVSQNCTTCHGTTPTFGAPMPLMKHADFQALSKSNPAKKVWEITPPRINATDITKRMPPASGTAIAAPGLKAFNDWLAAGAIAMTPSCDITAKPATTGAAGGGAVGMPGGPVSTGMGGGGKEPRTYNDPQMKCFEFRAHAQGNKTTPYSVSTVPDQYTNFSFAAPWKGMHYARSFRILDGNADVIHHWLLYKDAAPGADGGVAPSIGAHPTGELVHGWAPGGSPLYFDPDVGLEMPDTAGYTLETHHNNTKGSAQPDNSGVEVCVTPAVPKNVASLSWLGTDALGGTTATGACQPTSNQPIRILGVSPHMHLKGRHMKAVITRAGGKAETMHDEPFDFQYQHSYDTPGLMLMPGDKITTTCTFSSPANFGEGTNDEMCYMFTLYYPKFSLTNGNPIASLIHGANTCM